MDIQNIEPSRRQPIDESRSMTVWVLRTLFLLTSAGIGYQVGGFWTRPGAMQELEPNRAFWGIIIGAAAAILIIALEHIFSRRPVRSIGAILLGIVAGFVVGNLLTSVVMLAVGEQTSKDLQFGSSIQFEQVIKLILVTCATYITVVLIYKTRDQFRFIIPYVEFRREQRSMHPAILDTSAIIDGRIGEVCQTGIIEGPLLVPKFVLQELHVLSDSSDAIRRRRGRRGLDMLHRLQRNESIDIQLHDGTTAVGSSVDAKLISLAGNIEARVITCDYNLSKIAELQGVPIINVNDLANALRPIALPGEEIQVKVIRPGDEPGQGVGFMPDGTMVVVEQGRERIGENVTLAVTSVLQTSAGRMIFGRVKEAEGEGRS